jgi:hypothetical protein
MIASTFIALEMALIPSMLRLKQISLLARLRLVIAPLSVISGGIGGYQGISGDIGGYRKISGYIGVYRQAGGNRGGKFKLVGHIVGGYR